MPQDDEDVDADVADAVAMAEAAEARRKAKRKQAKKEKKLREQREKRAREEAERFAAEEKARLEECVCACGTGMLCCDASRCGGWLVDCFLLLEPPSDRASRKARETEKTITQTSTDIRSLRCKRE